MVIKQRVLVQLTSEGLAAVKVMVLPGGDLLYNPAERVVIIPGKPIAELLPFIEHREEVKAIVMRAMKISPTA